MFLTSLTSIFLAVIFLASLSEGQPKCGQGKFRNGKKCDLCPPGTYQNKRNATFCKPCPPGTYSPFRGAQGLDICRDCPQGTFRNKPGARSRKDCKKCPRGKNAPAGSPECIFCPPGKFISNCETGANDDYSSTFRGNCLTCEGGTTGFSCSLVGPIKLKCLDCSKDSFSKKPNSFGCKFCPSYTYSAKGSSTCKRATCPPGSEHLSNGRCRTCRGSAFSDGTSCRFCPPGYIGNSQIGAVKCVPCPAGTFKDQENSRCLPCKPGENSFVKGAAFCVPDNTPCPPNFFRNKIGACLRCSRMQRFDAKRKVCVKCPKNSFSEGGFATTCIQCPPGAEVRDKFIPIFIHKAYFKLGCFCRAGWGFGDGEGINGGKCRKCPPGTASRGDFYCEECFEGSYAPKSGMTWCLKCPRGTSQPLKGQTKCVRNPPCRKGLVKSEEGVCVEPATNCPPNHRRVFLNDEFETPRCRPLTCPAGTALLPPDTPEKSKKCGVCDKAHRYSPRNKRCILCANDEISDGGLSQVCKKLPEGLGYIGGKVRCVTARQMVDGKCVECPTGTFGFTHVGGCEACPAGTYSGRGYPEFCMYCPAGTFSETGSGFCKPCPEGTVSFGVGDSACVRPGSLKS